MKITLKMSQVVAAQVALQRIELPAKAALILARAARPIVAEAELFEQQRQRLVQRYGTRQGQQTVVEPDGPRWGEFAAELAALLESETTVELEPIRLEDLGIGRIAPGVLAPIAFLFD